MIRWRHFPLAALAVMLCAGCGGDKDNFTIEAEVDGLGAQIVTMTYVSSGALVEVTAEARDGKFELEGSSPELTCAAITGANGRSIAELIVKDGDEVRLSMKLDDVASTKVEGSEPSAELAAWKAENRELVESDDINAAVAKYVRAHPASAAAAWLVADRYYVPGHEREAAELYALMAKTPANAQLFDRFAAAVARVGDTGRRMAVNPVSFYGADSMVHFRPAARTAHLLAFTGGKNDASRDSVTRVLRSLTKRWGTKRFRALELSLVADSMAWRNLMQSDSAVNWLRCWVPGSVAASSLRKLKVPRTPFFVVVDSASVQRYRGSSAAEASDTLEYILNYKK